jgi:hypothetical protein
MEKKKSQKPLKTLRLHKEALRPLTTIHLVRVHGGANDPWADTLVGTACIDR